MHKILIKLNKTANSNSNCDKLIILSLNDQNDFLNKLKENDDC